VFAKALYYSSTHYSIPTLEVVLNVEPVNFQLTARDVLLMSWINDHGFVTIDHVATFIKTTVPRAYSRVKRLVQHGYLRHNRIFHGTPGVYRTTLAGIRLSESELPPLHHVPLPTYQHDLRVVEISLLLLDLLGGAFITERLLRKEAGIARFNQSLHISDGLLKINGKTIAIEVELSKKSKSRRETIMQHYLANNAITQVWYFCRNEAIREGIQHAAQGVDFVHCFLLDEVLMDRTIVKGHFHGK
jgi:hypothetical protein